ncbi:Crp/Fnr family transcriptional regulator [Variovorax sp. VNK109]|jgi:CRP/FNR family cyclic AMP-dependent transcriptional regulator|uniref:Crp/Fnr family transcriptional regulator n=1 Tax=Variovorax sp. VNK109 TaxID=3400919 RepID=UPI003BFB1333
MESTAATHPVLSLCARLPAIDVAPGEVFVQEGVHTGRLYVLESGTAEVVSAGVRVVAVSEPGSFLGEISALLGSPPTASVAAVGACRLRVLENADAVVQSDAAFTHAIAMLLARRLQAVTAYLVDIKRQYGEGDTHLALMDQVLANLMTLQARKGLALAPGSERADVPDY